jgi:ABC-type dipeptide/oligopeptide/nickel transport system permease component
VQIGLARFIVRRAAFAAALVLVVSSAALLLAALAPPAGSLDADPEAVKAERARLGLDRPLHEQYAAWIARAVRLDFGESIRFGRPVGALIRERAGNTLLLGASALGLATLIGIPLGVFTGSRTHGALATAGTRRVRAAARGAAAHHVAAAPPAGGPDGMAPGRRPSRHGWRRPRRRGWP